MYHGYLSPGFSEARQADRFFQVSGTKRSYRKKVFAVREKGG